MPSVKGYESVKCPQCNGQGYYGIQDSGRIRMRICVLCRGDGNLLRRIKADTIALQRVNEFNLRRDTVAESRGC